MVEILYVLNCWKERTMTYKELVEILRRLPEENQKCDVTIYDRNRNEFYALKSVSVGNTDVLDAGHPYLEF